MPIAKYYFEFSKFSITIKNVIHHDHCQSKSQKFEVRICYHARR